MTVVSCCSISISGGTLLPLSLAVRLLQLLRTLGFLRTLALLLSPLVFFFLSAT
jgi:hypothetical protein